MFELLNELRFLLRMGHHLLTLGIRVLMMGRRWPLRQCLSSPSLAVVVLCRPGQHSTLKFPSDKSYASQNQNKVMSKILAHSFFLFLLFQGEWTGRLSGLAHHSSKSCEPHFSGCKIRLVETHCKFIYKLDSHILGGQSCPSKTANSYRKIRRLHAKNTGIVL